MVNSFCRPLSTRPSSSSAAVDDAPSFGADEADVAIQLGVEVAGKEDALGPLARNRGDDVGHRRLAERRVGDEDLQPRPDAGGFQLRGDVIARLADCRRARGPGPGGDLLLEVGPGLLAIE